jgi:hypothetical protein
MSSPRAIVMMNSAPHYKRECFKAGLARLGYQVIDRPAGPAQKGDVLMLWNRHQHEDAIARAYEASGAIVLVAENGYIGTDENGGKLFALAQSYHNGAGKWNVGSPSRWASVLHPWRASGEFILVLPQRGIGPSGIAMPRNWQHSVMQKLPLLTKRPIKVRPHPGQNKHAYDVYPAFKGAHAVVTWGSGAAIKALHAGVPVFYEFNRWIGASAALTLDGADIEKPFLDDRLPMFQRLAWAQWSLKEIETGDAFAWHLR